MKKAEFTSLLFPGKIETSPGRPLSSVLGDWIDEHFNLRLAPGVTVTPTKTDPCTQLVFKRTRSADGTESIAFLGSTVSAVSYSSLADFSFTASEVHMHGPAISKQATPQMYNFEGNPSAAAIEARLATKTEGAVAFLRFRDETSAPSAPTALMMAQPAAMDEDSLLLQRVQTLFAERPVWQRASLEEALDFGPVAPWRLANALRLVSYLFLDGPWRKCYVRFGFDPRTDASARRLQMIDFRDPFFRNGGQADSTGVVDIHFRRAPTNRSQLYQLCDIDDGGIQALLAGPCKMPRADAHTGWLTEAELDSVRNQMKIKSESMRRDGVFK